MQWFKQRNLKMCVTECDVMLPSVKFKVNGKKHTVLGDHIARGTVLVAKVDGKPVLGKDNKPVYVRKKNAAFDAAGFFKKRRRHYKVGLNAQRLDQRDLPSAIVSENNVESFSWWDFDDDLEEAADGSNFRYHGYLFHRHLVCQHCQSDPTMQVKDDDNITYYMKPAYWGTVAAFKRPGIQFRR